MEFLVEMQVQLPPDMPTPELDDLRDRERRRARALRAEGVIARVWRVPGRTANVGVWEVADADALHAAISSLPLFPWLDVQVTPLATHYLEQADG